MLAPRPASERTGLGVPAVAGEASCALLNFDDIVWWRGSSQQKATEGVGYCTVFLRGSPIAVLRLSGKE